MSNAESQREPPHPRRRWCQYSLRTLLMFMVLASLGVSWFAVKMRQASRQREAAESLFSRGAYCFYDYMDDLSLQPPGPDWLRDLLGVDFFSDIVEVHSPGGNELERLAVLPQLTRLSITDALGKDDSQRVTDASVRMIRGLKRLEKLEITSNDITDAGLEPIGELTRLRELYLTVHSPEITDEAFAPLQRLSALDTLWLDCPQMTDEGLQHFERMTQLRHVTVLRGCVTDEGVKKLQKALPACTIE
ncbi:MAG: hypothetical protein LLG00_00485 [Planctomycetaceae bacterium]|nr:hypothetical protein [Planctomycetaceae bacterium]